MKLEDEKIIKRKKKNIKFKTIKMKIIRMKRELIKK